MHALYKITIKLIYIPSPNTFETHHMHPHAVLLLSEATKTLNFVLNIPLLFFIVTPFTFAS